MIKAVIFDLDGLIIDCDLMNYSVYKGVMAKLGYDFKVVDYVQNYLGKTDMKIAEMLIDKYYLPYEVKDFLKESFLVESKLLKEGVKLKKGVKELLTYLKENNFKIALASLSSESRTRNILKHHKIDTYFDCFTFGHEVAKGKPNPEIFKKTCAKLNEKPEDCVILEDGEIGIQAAGMAGIRVICIPGMKVPADEYLGRAIGVYESLDAIIPFLEENK